MIVGALRIDRDRPARPLIQDGERVAAARIVQPEQDDAPRLGPKRMRALAALAGLGEPGHVALPALGEKLSERVAGARDGLGRGKADRVEAKRVGFPGDQAFQRLCHDV